MRETRASTVFGRSQRTVVRLLSASIVLIFWPATSSEALAKSGPAILRLPKPRTRGGLSLLAALKRRHTSRVFSKRPLSRQTLSNLLWAAAGVNRPASGRRTAPTARNWQEIDIYVALAGGLYLYEHKRHRLRRVLGRDIRKETGKQSFVGSAPVNLIYVANRSRMGKASEADKSFYAATDTGFISQNVYLFCAATGLATVVRGWVDRRALARIMGLRADQRITLAQTVGHPGRARRKAGGTR